jgi:proteasome accessory factor A
VIVGDSSMSEVAMSEVATYLKVGTTALVLDMLEDGCFRENLGVEAAVGALRAISRDPTLRQRVRLRDGRSLTALEIQLVYLEACQAHVRRTGADASAQALLARWDDILTRLGRDPMTADRHVDWVIKKSPVDRYVARQGASLADPRVRLLG